AARVKGRGRPALLRAGRAGGPLRRGHDRRRPGAGPGVGWLAPGRLRRAPALPVRLAVARSQPLLLLRPRPRVGARLPQVLLLCALPALALPQRPRVGEAPGRAGRDRLRAARQRLPLLRRRRGVGRDLRQAVGPRRVELLPALAADLAVAVDRRGSPAWLPLPARFPS